MKILMITPHLKVPGRRGGSIHQWELVKALIDLGNEVHLICQKPEELPNKKNLYYHFVPSSESVFLIPALTFISFLEAIYVSLIYKINVIHDRGYIFGGSGTFAGLLLMKKRILQVDENWVVAYKVASDEKGLIKTNNLLEKIAKIWIKLMFLATNKICTVSDTLAKSLSKEYNINRDQFVTVPNGADIEHFNPNINGSEVRKEYGILISTSIVTFVGEIAKWQGVKDIIKAAPIVIKEHPDTRFMIVGGHYNNPTKIEFKHYLDKLVEKYDVKESIIFTGIQPYEKISLILAASDICLAPFTEEGKEQSYGFSPLKLFEYMAAGKPIIATDISWIREIVGKSSARIIPPSNPANLAKEINYLIENSKHAAQISKNGFHIVNKKYSWKNISKKLIDIYSKIS